MLIFGLNKSYLLAATASCIVRPGFGRTTTLLGTFIVQYSTLDVQYLFRDEFELKNDEGTAKGKQVARQGRGQEEGSRGGRKMHGTSTSEIFVYHSQCSVTWLTGVGYII